MRRDFSMKKPPSPKPIAKQFTLHGHKRTDEFSWLQDKKSSAVANYFNEENRYADVYLDDTKSLAKKLYLEMKSRIKETDMSVPVEDGPFLYYNRTMKGKQYPIHCRKRGKNGKEEIVLDENKLAKGKKFFSLGAYEVSPDHTLLAYAVDSTGNEDHTLYIKNLETGELLPEVIKSVSAGEWCFDGTHLFYAKEMHPFPPRHVYRHRLGDDPENDVLVFSEKDTQWYVSIGKTRSEEYLIISVSNFDSSEMHVLSARDPLGKFVCVAPRQKKVKYMVEHWGNEFFITTNEKAVNYKIMTAPESNPQKKFWKPYQAHNKNLAITGLYPNEQFLAMSARENGSEWLYVKEHRDEPFRCVPLPEKGHSLTVIDEIPFSANYMRLGYSSFLTPRTVYDYIVRTKKLEQRKQVKVPAWNREDYIAETIFITSKDGTQVPVSLCKKKSVKRDGKAPALVQFYGSYGITYDPFFSIAQLSLLKRGWVIAIVHARGGGEMGWNWHEKVKLTTKHKTYEDIIAGVDTLVKKKYIDRNRSAITGGSAGGMTLGAILNMRPDISRAAVAYVPNSDTVTSMLDRSLGGTELHYDELGDPRIKKIYHYLMRWSPYENIQQGKNYPSLLVRASAHDIRTPAWEAAKWVARLRTRATLANPLLLAIEQKAGHSGKSGRYEWIKERAKDYAFVINECAE